MSPASPASTRPPRIALALASMLVVLVACDRGPVDPARPASKASTSPRVVSLSPALTQALIDLGARDLLVGRTPFAPEEVAAVPVVGDLLDPELERIIAVRPDLLLIQPAASGVDPALRAMAEQRGWSIGTWRINRLRDVEGMVRDLVPLLVAAGADPRPLEAARTAWEADARGQLDAPCPALAEAGELVVLYGVDPPAAFGSGTYLDDVLRRLGGTNAITRPGYPELSLEDLAILDPDTLLVLGDRDRGELIERRLADAGRQPRVVVLEDGALLVPGTRLVDGVRGLRAAFGCDVTPEAGATP